MVEGLYKNKYRIASARHKDWNYANDGFYFVTICTKEKELFFGDVVKGQVMLNGVGEIAKKYWLEIPQHFDNIILDEYIIMPNHIHGILIIENDKIDESTRGRDAISCIQNGNTVNRRDAINRIQNGNTVNCRDAINRVSTVGGGVTGKYNQMGKKSLSEIIRWFKGRCKFEIKNHDFFWQTRFYDHIIRNEKALGKIRKYIHDNPVKWELDRNNPENIWM